MEKTFGKFRCAVHFMCSVPVQVKCLKKQGQEPMANKENYYNHGVY